MNTIFYGNGLNLLSSNASSWDVLIRTIKEAEAESKIPNTLQYEAKCLLEKMVSDEGEKELKKRICKDLKTYQTNEIYSALSKLGAEHYITTNYDFTMQISLLETGFTPNGGDHSETKYSLKRHVEYADDNSLKKVWYIHGEFGRLNSIMLGHKHYCDSISKMIEFIEKEDKEEPKNKQSLINRLKSGNMTVLSWIDLLFLSDIHIIGYGLYYEEIDLWWLLTYRKRLIDNNPSLIKNKIILYGDVPQGKSELLINFGVEIVPSEKTEYMDKYKEYIEKIENSINNYLLVELNL